MPRACVAPGCNEGYGSKPSKYSFFIVPKDPIKRARWQAAIPRKNFELMSGQAVCEKHFAPEDIIRKRVFRDGSGAVIAEIVYKQPRCAENAVPTVFPGCPEHILKALKRRRETLQKDSILKAERVKVPDTWSRIVRVDGPKAVFYTQAVSKKIKEQIVPLFVKQVCVNENANFTFSEMGKTVSNQHLSISPEPLTSCQELREILLMFNSVKLCCGTKLDKKLSDWECVCLWLDLSGCYRHHNCSLVVSEDSVCKEYKKIQRTIR